VRALAIVVAGAWAYATSFGGAFVFDDFAASVQNPNVRTLWPLTRAMAAPPDITLSGRPVASLTFALNYALTPADAREVSEPPPAGAPDAAERFARNVRGYHAVNLAIHLAAALVLFGVVRRTLPTARLRPRFQPAATGLAFATALLWVVHPLHTEAVTYIIQRVESLMGLSVLLALSCAIRAADAPHARARLWTAGAIARAALGAATKEMAATIPVLVVLWDWIFLAPGRGEAHRAPEIRQRRWPLYAGLAATWALLAVLAPGARARSVGLGLQGWTPWTYLLTQSRVLVHCTGLAFWPSPLVLDPYWPMVRSLGEVAAPAAGLTLLLGLTAIGVWRRHPLAFAGAWFFVILAPTSSVLPIVTEVAAEHRMYLPLATIIAAAVVALHLAWHALDVCRRRQGAEVPGATGEGATTPGMTRRWTIAAAVVLLTLVVVPLGLATRARKLDYASDEAIWRDTIRKQPGNPRARTALGANLVVAGRYAEAEATLREALALDPANAETLSNLGAAEYALGQIDASVAHLERAVAVRPEYVDAHRNLAEACVARRDHARAVVHFLRVLEARPDHVVVLNHCGLILAVSPDDRGRDGAKALELAQRAVRLTSRRDAASLSTLAAALAELDRFDEAVAALREALALAQGQPALVAEFERRLAAYEAHQKVRLSQD
jgi:tetratricopeptide (TPR) repeat protein